MKHASEEHLAAERDWWQAEAAKRHQALLQAMATVEQMRVRILVLEGERDEAIKERDRAVQHDRQPYPTVWAYKKVCEARDKHHARARELTALLMTMRQERDAAKGQAALAMAFGRQAENGEDLADALTTKVQMQLAEAESQLTALRQERKNIQELRPLHVCSNCDIEDDERARRTGYNQALTQIAAILHAASPRGTGEDV